MSSLPNHPFGLTITDAHILATMRSLQGWEARYRQLILWGKQLPVMEERLKSDQAVVAGCESQVWLVSGQDEQDGWLFCADSDARIVRGLIAVVLAALNAKTGEQIAAFDMDAYFSDLGLLDHLSPSRGNGLKAIVEKIRTEIA
ncbi:cysteine desulfurase sulfur acceptor subunit CsdE [Vibrio metschnikovii]|uniref:Cysteine desulfurase sulfur acceptor subunit CsdE n=3 Tax=Unclassified Bacteria TaxID=49928 RepID=A0AAU6UWK1_UNCXX|nr:cysteine desulfurase sulfur acceptor subunit CsdE [Vibrio sp. A8-1]EKO3589677.1 cysteine desulfurase sulfur acceptor subunit CsdE [Vibrio metschnikovii]EKO3642936.1 cysteine desulfurase sulfur acceptor subunit CsdE [Vibrio metschnikovii]EKO3661596.1 cysteine desulfurase sulfur acceptor subunit CsdE [Vibrio metschnikovii]EKO3697246.1 cysteine desulfurase sulfur acceptor subunit CsdE [Vibrio metschnikovii]EKO3717432.1 cysteine desulfurase sulfur acceptor subunit CsdE [Vibrio metschnikovii]